MNTTAEDFAEPIKARLLLKKPGKFKFGDMVRFTGNPAFDTLSGEGVVVGRLDISCPMSIVRFRGDDRVKYISDNELELI